MHGHHGRPGWGHQGWGGFGGSAFGKGPQGWLTEMLGLDPRGGPWQRQAGDRPRARRGDVRSAILDVLRESDPDPINGYQITQRITERSRGAWTPSPGSVYPTIQQLEDEGLVRVADGPGSRHLVLTDRGKEYVAERHRELLAVWSPFEDAPGGRGGAEYAEIAPEIGQVLSALWQVVTQGSDAQRRAAVDVLADTRHRLFGLLAQDGQDEWGAGEDGPAS